MAMQSFFEKINFVRKFTLNFAETIKPLQKMIRKDVELKWNDERKMIAVILRLQYIKLQCCEVLTLARIFSSILLSQTNL
jgi:hypothetical protein